MKTVCITQPTYLPWLGYFCLIKESDVFVFLDHVQYVKRSWQNRNRIKTSDGWMWLTVPTHSKKGESINEVSIDNTKAWRKKHLNSIKTHYGKAPYFKKYYSFFESLYNKDWDNLSDLNVFVIKHFTSELGLSPNYVKSSKLNLKQKRTGLALEICKKLEADRYVSSIGAKEYMRKDGAEELFKDEGIKLEFFEYKHPVYPQLYDDFVTHTSIIDCLFNCGPESPKIIFNKNLYSFTRIKE
jgi:hypothetical protein